jgi:hypothetical protein
VLRYEVASGMTDGWRLHLVLFRFRVCLYHRVINVKKLLFLTALILMILLLLLLLLLLIIIIIIIFNTEFFHIFVIVHC